MKKTLLATELRIGNYLSLPTRGEELVIVEQILEWTAIAEGPINEREHFIICNTTSNEWPIEDYAHIPLTEEWLSSFGFAKIQDDNIFIFKKGKVALNQTGGKGFFTCTYNGSFIKFVKTVHGLQNLYFALTGKELN